MILLDTHVWVWWIGDPDRLSDRARQAIDSRVGAKDIYISSISVWEVALLTRRGRLELAMPLRDWIGRSEALPFLTFVPVDNPIAIRSTELAERLHDDPADRIIVATALSLGASLVTRDRRILEYEQVKSIW